MYKGKSILYDTGDFIDDYAVDERERNDLSALLLIHIAPPVVQGLDLAHVQISDMQVNLARGREREWFVQRLTRLCREMGTEVLPSPQKLSVSGLPEHTEGMAR